MKLEEIIENVKEAKLILLCNNVIELIVVITEGKKQGLFKNKFWDLENDEELDLNKLKNIAIEPVLKELDKQEKMIELMLQEMTDCEFEMKCGNCNYECERDYDQLYSCNKQYFEKKAEESE